MTRKTTGRTSHPFLHIILLITMLLGGLRAGAQNSPLQQARDYVAQKQYDKAKEAYKQLYEQTPADQDVYQDYLQLLLTLKDYKGAEKLLESQLRVRQQDPLLMIDMGRVFAEAGQKKKADEQFDHALQLINGDDILTTQMANAFTNMGNDQYAIRTYERARDLLRNPYLYGSPLARLYARTGDIDKSVNALLEGAPGQPGGIEEVKTTMLEMLGTDPKKQQLAQKAIVKRINAQPESAYYADLLTWLYTQRGDWEGALIQVQALDERNREGGQRLLEFSREAQKQSQYDIAVKALDAVVEKGNTLPFYAAAKTEKLNVAMRRLENDPFYKPEDVAKLSKEYETFFTEFPQFYATETLRDYATLEAQYNNNPQKAIELLQHAIDQPTIRKDLAGQCKLQMGDYTVLTGKIWDASLLYSQVDKAFREDMLGEEARFRNAKLAYYRGDFDWAQGQLSVLKASTSELIANDALYLSVLITENVAPDSNVVPLQRFAAADLLLFQNKTHEAETLLDSISQAFPKHPLNDDILMLRAQLEEKRHNYPKAIDYLKQVYGQYGKDVLGDDAVFKTAEIYHQYLHQDEEAKALYEKLIIDYPGSTFVQTARLRLQSLQPAAP